MNCHANKSGVLMDGATSGKIRMGFKKSAMSAKILVLVTRDCLVYRRIKIRIQIHTAGINSQ
jgi:hypothetical protein